MTQCITEQRFSHLEDIALDQFWSGTSLSHSYVSLGTLLLENFQCPQRLLLTGISVTEIQEKMQNKSHEGDLVWVIMTKFWSSQSNLRILPLVLLAVDLFIRDWRKKHPLLWACTGLRCVKFQQWRNMGFHHGHCVFSGSPSASVCRVQQQLSHPNPF